MGFQKRPAPCVCAYTYILLYTDQNPLYRPRTLKKNQPHHQNHRQGFPVFQKRPAQGATYTQPKRPRGCHDGSMRCSASLCSVPVLCNTLLVRFLPCSQPTLFPPSVLEYYCTSDQSRDHIPPPSVDQHGLSTRLARIVSFQCASGLLASGAARAAVIAVINPSAVSHAAGKDVMISASPQLS